MSKEIAQTVGGKKIAWLIAIVAAFAVFATVSLQNSPAYANVLSLTCDDVDAPAADQNPIAANTIIYCRATTSAAITAGTVVWTATGTGGNTVGSISNANADTTVGTAPSASFTFTVLQGAGAVATGGITVTVAFSDANGPHAATETGQTESYTTANVTGAVGAAFNLGGTNGSATFSLPAGFQCTSDVTAPGATARTCALSDVSFGTTGTATATALTVTPSGNNNAAGTVVVTFLDSAGVSGGTITPRLSVYNNVTGDPVNNSFVVSTATAKGVGFAEIRHMSDVANTVIPRQEINNNVRGSRHTVCLVQQNTGIDLNADGDALDAGEAAVAVAIPGITLANIVITNGGGYASLADTDPTFTDARIFTGDGTVTGLPSSTATAGLSGATCVSWVSTDAGDQQINIVYVGLDGLQYNASWDSDGDNNDASGATNGPANRSIIKEWNRLEDSLVTLSGGATGSASGTSTTVPVITRNINVVLNPATGLYQFSPVSISDVFRGNHTNSAGVLEGNPTPLTLAGVNVTAKVTGCGNLNGVTTTITGVTALDNAGNVILVDSTTGAPLTFSFTPGPSGVNCGPGLTADVTFTGSEPGPLGSGTGNTVTEIIRFTFAQNIAEKQVFLAWAGQRIILEHDWRLAPGDGGPNGGSFTPNVGPTPNGICPFSGLRLVSTQDPNLQTQDLTILPMGDPGDFLVQYIKGTGPGNFVPGLGASVDGADQAYVAVGSSDTSQTLQIAGQDNDIIGDPQDNCISRVLYESEDPGEVDIEAFAYDGFDLTTNYTKVAFVVYYMKINTINVSLVTQVSKPSHNSSNRIGTGVSPDATHYADYAPGNPWDASTDDADNAADWNVSKDLLVRGRVTGWFVNSNPSGRPADASNPLNVLPANRWVMPNDWALLAGGPADNADGSDAGVPNGTAETFRPYYDLMFAPVNARGITLATPEGALAVNVTSVVTVVGVTNTSGAFRVGSCADLALLPANAALWVGSDTSVNFTSCVAGLLTVTNLASTPAAGTLVYIVTGVPFEGPYSTLDIVGLAAQGLGGAALSDIVPGSIRDTTLDDGDVDWWDAPMPVAPVSVAIRGTGFIKEVIKDEVYYVGTPNSAAQVYTNPYYIIDIPGSPFIPAVVAGGGYHWNTWGNDGPGGNGQGVYRFWTPAIIGTNSEGFPDSFTAAQTTELGIIRAAYGDNSIARDLVVFSDNHGEFMVTANGDYRTDLTACASNVLAGGKHCKPGDHVGTGTIRATVDYPDFRGKHFPVLSNAATVTWTWAGYKDVTVVPGETDQYKYIVFHAMDRDGFCSPLTSGAVLLHPVHTATDNLNNFNYTGNPYAGDPNEYVDFLIDSGEGIIIGSSPLLSDGKINDGKQFATGVGTFSTAENTAAGTPIKQFGFSSLAPTTQTDECQAWIKVSNSLLGILNVLAIAHDDEYNASTGSGNIGFDLIIDLTNTTSYTLNFRWSLVTWAGADAISVNDAIKGTGTTGKNPGGNDISASVTAIYGWDAAAQQWLGFFPSGVNVPGANDLTGLKTGQAYWIAITGPSSVTWTIASNVN